MTVGIEYEAETLSNLIVGVCLIIPKVPAHPSAHKSFMGPAAVEYSSLLILLRVAGSPQILLDGVELFQIISYIFLFVYCMCCFSLILICL